MPAFRPGKKERAFSFRLNQGWFNGLNIFISYFALLIHSPNL